MASELGCAWSGRTAVLDRRRDRTWRPQHQKKQVQQRHGHATCAARASQHAVFHPPTRHPPPQPQHTTQGPLVLQSLGGVGRPRQGWNSQCSTPPPKCSLYGSTAHVQYEHVNTAHVTQPRAKQRFQAAEKVGGSHHSSLRSDVVRCDGFRVPLLGYVSDALLLRERVLNVLKALSLFRPRVVVLKLLVQGFSTSRFVRLMTLLERAISATTPQNETFALRALVFLADVQLRRRGWSRC